MKAKIERNVYGQYYITVDAETTIEKFQLTEMRKQAEECGGYVPFGGAAGPVEDEEVSCHLDYRHSIKVADKPDPPKPKKKKGLWRT